MAGKIAVARVRRADLAADERIHTGAVGAPFRVVMNNPPPLSPGAIKPSSGSVFAILFPMVCTSGGFDSKRRAGGRAGKVQKAATGCGRSR